MADWQERDAVIERIAAGEKVRPDLPPGATAMVQRSAATAAVINRFYRTLHLGDRRALFPADDVRAVTASMAWSRDPAGG